MSADAPTPLDLDAIRAMLGDRLAVTTRSVALDLLAEVERLRAEVRLATTSAHSASLALGAQLTARPAPAWDEEVMRDELVVAVREAHRAADTCSGPWADEAMTDAALAVVRDHLPVKPSREDVADVLYECGTWCGMADVSHEYGPCPACVERCMGDAHAVLDLWPGRSEAEVKAEALWEWAEDMTGDLAATKAEGIDLGRDYLHGMRSALMQATERADRLAAEGGADRG